MPESLPCGARRPVPVLGATGGDEAEKFDTELDSPYVLTLDFSVREVGAIANPPNGEGFRSTNSIHSMSVLRSHFVQAVSESHDLVRLLRYHLAPFLSCLKRHYSITPVV